MYNIKDDIKNSTYQNLYLLCGEEEYLIEHYANEIINANTDKDTAEFNLMKIFKEMPSEEEIDTFINSYPFMSEKKVILFQSTGIFKSSTEAQKSYFMSVFSSIPEYIIIIFAEPQINKNNPLYKEIKKRFAYCEFEYQDNTQLTRWIVGYLKKSGKEISGENAAYIAQTAGPSMLSVKSELEKIISLAQGKDTVTYEMIDSVITRNIENRVFMMVDDFADKKVNSAFEKLNDLKSLNEEPIKIISIIFKKFANYHKLILLKNKPISEICSLIGMYEKYARNDLNKAGRIGAKKIAAVMIRCRDMDFAVKSGKIDKWLAVETIIGEIISD